MKKKMVALISSLLVFAALLGLMACTGTPTDTQPGSDTVGGPDTTVKADETTAAEGTPEESTSADVPVTVPESIKILAIGNSFSTDCMEYLWKLLKDAGIENVVLGNLYYGGCSMAQHLNFVKTDSASYTYYKNTKGAWTSTANYTMAKAVANEEWDIITVQETSKTCGVDSAYKTSFTKLTDEIRKLNDKAVLVWNMTWAYQQDSTHSSFPNYDKDQMKMYTMTTECVQKYIGADDRYSYVIPVGTAVQNARTSYLGDHLTRDGYHLNKEFGRYLAALTWTCKITGVSPYDIAYNPVPGSINEDMVSVARESVKNALAVPYGVTKSEITTGKGSLAGSVVVVDPSEILNPEDFIEADRQVAVTNGTDLSKYTLLKWDYLENTYWNCTSKAGTTTPASTAGTYHQNICTKNKYSVATELPEGTIIICDGGWQYRLEKYVSENDKYTGKRPDMSNAPFFVLTSDFIGDAKYISWNVASSPKSDISAIYAQAAAHVRIYVPNK